MKGWEAKLSLESATVSELRKKNSVFDEICRDYEEMLEELERNHGHTDSTDLQETVAALEQELFSYLQD